ncbi:MAG: nicotinate phosphoribosyltransferase [Firmicutes bacterium]|nr:nicotinate phosphoribosyltransferase [Bacillota bacterium]
MSIFDGKRLNPEIFRIDAERMRRGWYSDEYFANTVKVLQTLANEGYTFQGESDLPQEIVQGVKNGDLEVEMQIFARRQPYSLIAGVDEALAILQSCTGYFTADGNFVNTAAQLEVEAVQDGTFAFYDGNPRQVEPVIRIRGRYRDFAILETPILGTLTETTRVATNVYEVLKAAGGKDVLFFPARFAHYKIQALHGYAYSLAVQAYNAKYGKKSQVLVSTYDQAGWWGGSGNGTMAHATIACFLGDAATAMVEFSRILPVSVPRIALVDFHNDCVGDTLRVMKRMFDRYWEHYAAGDFAEANKYKLAAVRLDTSSSMRDVSVAPLGKKELDCGVNPRLVWIVRQAIDQAYTSWSLPAEAESVAAEWCKQVKIVATGGFDAKRIREFEELAVPVDTYGVGSSLLENSRATGTNNDFTADIVRVKIGEDWYPLAKAGRVANDNPNLEKVDLTKL